MTKIAAALYPMPSHTGNKRQAGKHLTPFAAAGTITLLAREHRVMTKVTDGQLTESRKGDHIRINLEENVQFPNLTTGLEHYRFIHQAVPELDIAEVDTSVTLFGKRLNTPILISSMTGGVGQAQQINRNLAQAAQQAGIAMGLGSQRAAVERAELAAAYDIRSVAPDVLLFANLGVVQFNYGYGIDQCRRAVDMVEADALILHFNALQEAVQPEGDGNFKDLLPKIEQVCKTLGKPVIAKEVGWGFSERAARKLASVGIPAIDVAGAGGNARRGGGFCRVPAGFHAGGDPPFTGLGVPHAGSG